MPPKAKAKAKAGGAAAEEDESPDVTLHKDPEGYDSVVKHDPTRVATNFAAFKFCKGTVFSNANVWLDMAISMIVFALGIAIFYTYPVPDLDVGPLDAFNSTLQMPVGFLLGFYVGRNLGGRKKYLGHIGGTCGLASDVCVILHCFVLCKEEDASLALRINSDIMRYVEASLAMIFKKTRWGNPCFSDLKKMGLLTQEEVECLEQVPARHEEAIWMWIAQIVVNLRNQGYFEGKDWIFPDCHEKVMKGRFEIQGINGKLGSQTPYKYMQLLSCMLHLYIVMFLVSLSITASRLAVEENNIAFISSIARGFLVPFTFLSLFHVAAEFTNPFGTDLSDFPMGDTLKGVDNACDAFLDAIDNAPDWIEGKK